VSGGQGEGAYLTALRSVLARVRNSSGQLFVSATVSCSFPVASLRSRPHARSARFSRNLALLSPLPRAFLRLTLYADSCSVAAIRLAPPRLCPSLLTPARPHSVNALHSAAYCASKS
jgi:hypothetical protein